MSFGGYSRFDRFLHALAFGGISVQVDVADIEYQMFRGTLETIDYRAPIFITSLPRAGTTLLLDLLVASGACASQTYRDMPFLLCPLLWNAISRNFRVASDTRQRLHGDLGQIGFDSPEGFEEVLWRAFFPDHYRASHIDLWSAEDDAAPFRDFFRRHIRKVIALHVGTRYVSKNNANIARIGLLRKMFPECRIVVPFRDPFQQAMSLQRQHLRFLEVHDASPFSRRYMARLGHLEFGRLLTPFAFAGVEDLKSRDPRHPDFWLQYWVNAFTHILGMKEDVVLVSYDDLCIKHGLVFESLCDRLGLVALDSKAAARIVPAHVREMDAGPQDVGLADRARRLHQALRDNVQ